MQGSFALGDLTDAAASARIAEEPMALIACGSVEQHGPHLPAGTDTFIAESLAGRVAERIGAVLVPSTPLGVTHLHMGFASTVTLHAATYAAVVVDVAASLYAHGVRFLAAINWHEGNIPALAVALEQAQRTTGMQCVAVQACYIAADLLQDTAGPLSHGGQIETMLVMADHPHLVHLELVDRVPQSADSRRRDILRRDAQYQPIITDARDISPEGWHGDPRGATRQAGIDAMERVADAIAQRLPAMRAELG